jgi:hypothetical protein
MNANRLIDYVNGKIKLEPAQVTTAIRPRVVETLGEAVQDLCLHLLRDVGKAGGRLAGKRLFNAVEFLLE